MCHFRDSPLATHHSPLTAMTNKRFAGQVLRILGLAIEMLGILAAALSSREADCEARVRGGPDVPADLCGCWCGIRLLAGRHGPDLLAREWSFDSEAGAARQERPRTVIGAHAPLGVSPFPLQLSPRISPGQESADTLEGMFSSSVISARVSLPAAILCQGRCRSAYESGPRGLRARESRTAEVSFPAFGREERRRDPA